MADTKAASAEIEDGLTSKLVSVFDSGVHARKKYYDDNPNKLPSAADIDSIISACANTNALISGGFSLIPGPLGLIAVIPEIVLVIKNQVAMVYDIAAASGKRDVLTRELVLGVALSASGVSVIGLLTMHGSKVLVRRSSLRLFQSLVKAFAGKVTQQFLKSSIAKWLPLIGAAAIAAWTRYTTAELGFKAKDLFSREIEFEPDTDTPDGPVGPTTDSGVVSESPVAMLAKLLLLDDLMRCDGHEAPQERAYISDLLATSNLGQAERMEFIRRLPEPFPRVIDLTPFKSDEDERLGLLIDMVALSKRDNVVRQQELEFGRKTALAVGLTDRQVDAAQA
jgi:uncharacterized tellurite resistance protein B-like protein